MALQTAKSNWWSCLTHLLLEEISQALAPAQLGHSPGRPTASSCRGRSPGRARQCGQMCSSLNVHLTCRSSSSLYIYWCKQQIQLGVRTQCKSTALVRLNVFKIIALIKRCKSVRWKGLGVEAIDVFDGRQQCQGSQKWKDIPSSPPAGLRLQEPSAWEQPPPLPRLCQHLEKLQEGTLGISLQHQTVLKMLARA